MSRSWRGIVLAGSVAAMLAVAGCGQRGPLYLPTEPAAAQRAPLSQILNPRRDVPASRPAPAVTTQLPPPPAASLPASAPRP